MATKSDKAAADDPVKDETAGREAIEAQIARVRDELSQLGGLMAEYGSDRLRGAEMQTVEELQRQLATLESGMRRKLHEKPLQVLGLAAFAGLVVGLVLRR